MKYNWSSFHNMHIFFMAYTFILLSLIRFSILNVSYLTELKILDLLFRATMNTVIVFIHIVKISLLTCKMLDDI